LRKRREEAEIAFAWSGCKKNTPFHHLNAAVKAKAITTAIPQTMSSQDNKIMETKKLPRKKRHATHCNTGTSVTSVDSTWETQCWVNQPGELHAHLAVDFLHLSLLFNGENATQKK